MIPYSQTKIVQKMNKLSIKGLSKKEFEAYQGLLGLKKATVLELSNISNINRPTLYRLLKKLIKKGLISEIYEGKKHFYIAEKPEQLIKFINRQKQKIKKVLPELLDLEEEATERPKIKFYEGKEGIKNLYDELLREKDEILGFAWSDRIFKELPFHLDFVKKRIKRKIPVRLIAPDTKLARERKRIGKEELRKIKLIPQMQSFDSAYYITGNKVITFSLKRWFVGVLIENKEIADGLRAFFESFWRVLK
jgi:sugar-specific transcriptional regulator TrmB